MNFTEKHIGSYIKIYYVYLVTILKSGIINFFWGKNSLYIF